MAQDNRRKKQLIAISIVGAFVIAGFLILGMLFQPPSDPGLANNRPATVDETIISDRTSAASPEMSWITQGRIEMEKMAKELKEQRELLTQTRTDAAKQVQEVRNEYDDILLQQAKKIEQLEQERAGGSSASLPDNQPVDVSQPLTGREQLQRQLASEGPGSDFIRRRPPTQRAASPTTVGEDGRPVISGGWKPLGESFTLTALDEPQTDEREVRTLRNYLPAGSYAPAVVLSGADAATNVSNRENPIPVLFRITGPAVSAATGGRSPAKVNLKGCTVQGSATGDLSSERVKVRLITMTCINRKGAVLETKVSGYMAGSGKEGVRGHVTSREGPQVRNALVAGVIGGLGKGLSTATTSVLGNDDTSAEEALKGAGLGTIAGGAESAANSLAEYYITRAEQYQPVVSLYGGTKVELVFLEGVELGQ
ncbi:TrbI/VirB10 family protein [Ruegeria sp. HKCCD8929]|uniref:TrbI/VirB10 family protein n=1 Tax=Ruegeria sp. HKCCD8929 TaxID=2683006 RepID=UPI0020C35CF2|nr:TrbI/VirB10 family protein [Ruegeria sp. HKCCD8929]